MDARVARLPDETRSVLLLAAADEAGDLAALKRGARRLGVTITDLDNAEHDGLVRADGTVTFRHPLVRSVVYRSAGAPSGAPPTGRARARQIVL